MSLGRSTEYSLKFFAWCNDPENNSDKIWGWMDVAGRLYTFWGRRADLDTGGKKLRFKNHPVTRTAQSELSRFSRTKIDKGYRSIDLNRNEDGTYPKIEECYPGFDTHFKRQLTLARLSGTVKNEAV